MLVDGNQIQQGSCVCLLLLAGNVLCGTFNIENVIPQKGPIIIDTDAGVYDAAAILLLLSYDDVSVKAITCVRGNTDAITVAMNVQKTLNVVQRYDVPIHVGANYGLVHTEALKNIYGKDGFGDIDDNNNLLMSNLAKGHAAVAIAKMVTENPGKITVICMGPLTNLAIALHLQPQLLKLAKCVFIMGGSMTGMGTFRPGIEFNFEMDPEAAALVFSRAEATSSQVIVFPMEALADKPITHDWFTGFLETLNSPSAKFITRLLKAVKMFLTEIQTPERFNSLDVSMAACMMSPLYVTAMRRNHVAVDTQGGAARGVLLIDYTNATGKVPNAMFVLSTNHDELRRIIRTHLA